MDVTVLAALAEPNRVRIVELLADRPHSVGEIAAALGLRQPQVTKHVQTLDRAGIVDVHPLGRRRLCALRHAALDQLAQWAAQLAAPGPDDLALARYGAAIASPDPAPVALRRTVHATPAAIWRAFTDPAIATRWWHPRHFTVAAFGLEDHIGGTVEVILRDGDRTEHSARGRIEAFDRPRHLAFTLDPLDADGRALFTARHDVHLTRVNGGTKIELTITTSGIRPGAAAALAGVGIGWEQLLDNLTAAAGRRPV